MLVIIKRTRFPAMAPKYSNAFQFNISQSPWNWNQEQLMQRSILLVAVELDTEGTCLPREALKAWIRIGAGSVSFRSKVKWVAKKASHASTRMSRKKLARSEMISLSMLISVLTIACSRIELMVLARITGADVTAHPRIILTPYVKASKPNSRWQLNKSAGLSTEIHKQKSR